MELSSVFLVERGQRNSCFRGAAQPFKYLEGVPAPPQTDPCLRQPSISNSFSYFSYDRILSSHTTLLTKSLTLKNIYNLIDEIMMKD